MKPREGLAKLSTLLAAIACAQARALTGEATCSCTDIHPTYPPLDAPPRIEATEVADNRPNPTGADCLADHNRPATWVTVSSVVQTSVSQQALIQRFGAISELTSLLYWSTTDRAWRPIVSAAFAVDSGDAEKPRADYLPNDLAAGTPRYYRVTDTRTYAAVNYRLQLRPGPWDHIVLETTNVDPIRKWGITLYGPDGVHTLYCLNERSAGIWSYYSITRVLPATILVKGHEKSYINRAAALFRHYMRLPITAEPPAARHTE